MHSDYELVQVNSQDEWEAMHNLRRSELFARKEGVVYNPNHPDDRRPHHFPLVLKLNGKCIGTARLDLFENGEGAIRLVVIDRTMQGQGHGRVLMQKFEEFARGYDVFKIFVNANPTAVGYYERMGFAPEEWTEPEGSANMMQPCVQMAKII